MAESGKEGKEPAARLTDEQRSRIEVVLDRIEDELAAVRREIEAAKR